MLDFVVWLLWHPQRSCSAETADKYAGAVRAWLEVQFGLRYSRSRLHSRFVSRMRSFPRARGYAEPATRRLLELCAADTEAHPAVVDCAIIAFNGLFRPSELLPQRDWRRFPAATLLCEDVERVLVGGVPAFRTAVKCGKADRYNLGPFQYFMQSPVQGDVLCPVAAFERMLRRSPGPRAGVPFACKSWRPLVLVLAADVTALYRRHATAAGLDAVFTSAKSARPGGATHMADNGADQVLIQQRGRWSDRGTNEVLVLYQRATMARLRATATAMAGSSSIPLPSRRRARGSPAGAPQRARSPVSDSDSPWGASASDGSSGDSDFDL
jgi:hypothetical protein